MAAIDLKKATLTVKDGSTTPNELVVKIGEGNLTFSEKRNIEYSLDRGLLDTVKEGDQVPMEVNFEFLWEYIMGKDSSTPGLKEALTKTGGASGWVSSDTDACRPYAVDLELEYLPTPASCGDKETILLPDFRYESLDYDLRNAQISCAGKCNALSPSVTRAPQTT
jgi:hypothetical protein